MSSPRCSLRGRSPPSPFRSRRVRPVSSRPLRPPCEIVQALVPDIEAPQIVQRPRVPLPVRRHELERLSVRDGRQRHRPDDRPHVEGQRPVEEEQVLVELEGVLRVEPEPRVRGPSGVQPVVRFLPRLLPGRDGRRRRCDGGGGGGVVWGRVREHAGGVGGMRFLQGRLHVHGSGVDAVVETSIPHVAAVAGLRRPFVRGFFPREDGVRGGDERREAPGAVPVDLHLHLGHQRGGKF
mmetsp:Transcript_29795/g.46066  ORF Transcript_29795/g.46066 Transcript_29795/m.46066 type:complete len:237 (+) Transcript_29795:351-1061(+)